MSEWQPIETAPRDGTRVLFYRPLAHMSGDHSIDIKRGRPDAQDPWPSTVPDGVTPCNPTDGACHATHWMPLPEPPEQVK